jgi:putative NADH-flavin reductase
MKMAVLGASGGIGRLLVTSAAAAGHAVVAVSRGDVTVPAGVRVMRGDLGNVVFLESCFGDCDAVVSCLGLRLKGLAPWNRPEVPDFLDSSADAIIAAMKGRGLRRLVAVSSSGIGDSAPMLPGFFKAFIALSAMRHVWPALNRMEERYADSGLDVTCVRPTGLSDGPATGKIVEPKKLGGQAQIARADVAAWILAELQRPQIRRAVVITTTGAG